MFVDGASLNPSAVYLKSVFKRISMLDLDVPPVVTYVKQSVPLFTVFPIVEHNIALSVPSSLIVAQVAPVNSVPGYLNLLDS